MEMNGRSGGCGFTIPWPLCNRGVAKGTGVNRISGHTTGGDGVGNCMKNDDSVHYNRKAHDDDFYGLVDRLN